MERKILNISPTLICIPDISGFTKFMREVDFAESSKIIPALLNKIIYTNEMNLRVSEIEGDAVLFYKQGKLPSLEVLVNQCVHFYREFYEEMYLIAERYSEDKLAYKTPEMLGLKIILHYSEMIGMAQIGSHIKLLGEDVIIAHRFLKNSLKEREYLLLSSSTMTYFSKEERENALYWDKIQEDYIEEEDLGTISFNYIDLTPLI